MKKRILSLLLALVLCVGMLPAAALAAEDEASGGVVEEVPMVPEVPEVPETPEGVDYLAIKPRLELDEFGLPELQWDHAVTGGLPYNLLYHTEASGSGNSWKTVCNSTANSAFLTALDAGTYSSFRITTEMVEDREPAADPVTLNLDTPLTVREIAVENSDATVTLSGEPGNATLAVSGLSPFSSVVLFRLDVVIDDELYSHFENVIAQKGTAALTLDENLAHYTHYTVYEVTGGEKGGAFYLERTNVAGGKIVFDDTTGGEEGGETEEPATGYTVSWTVTGGEAKIVVTDRNNGYAVVENGGTATVGASATANVAFSITPAEGYRVVSFFVNEEDRTDAASKYGYTGYESKGDIYAELELEPISTAAVSNLRFVLSDGQPNLRWDSSLSDTWYYVYGSADGGETWSSVDVSYLGTYVKFHNLAAGTYNAFKVEAQQDGVTVGECINTNLTLTITEQEPENPADITVTAPTEENDQYTFTVTGLTPSAYFTFGILRSGATSGATSGTTSKNCDSNGVGTVTETASYMEVFVKDATTTCWVTETINGKVDENTASFTIVNHGEVLLSVLMGGDSGEGGEGGCAHNSGTYLTQPQDSFVWPTCTSDGSYVQAICCSMCDAELSRETFVLKGGCWDSDTDPDGICNRCGNPMPGNDFGITVKLNNADLIATITGPKDAVRDHIYTYYFYNTADEAVHYALPYSGIGAEQVVDFRPGVYDGYKVLLTADKSVLGWGELEKPVVVVEDAFEIPSVALTRGETADEVGDYTYTLFGADPQSYTYTLDTETACYIVQSDGETKEAVLNAGESAFANGATLHARLNSEREDAFYQEVSAGYETAVFDGKIGTTGEVYWKLEDGVLTLFGNGSAEVRAYPNLASEYPWTKYADEITAVVIEEGVTGFGAYMFDQFPDLTHVSLAGTLNGIGDGAFWGSPKLTSVSIGEGYTIIGYEMFRNCTALTSITLPSTLANLDAGAFNGCTSLKTVVFRGPAQRQIGALKTVGAGIPDATGLTLYYPANGWTAEKMEDVGANGTWVPVRGSILPNIPVDAFDTEPDSVTLQAVADAVSGATADITAGDYDFYGVRSKLLKANNQKDTTNAVVQVYVDVTLEKYSTGTDGKTLTLDITPRAQLYVNGDRTGAPAEFKVSGAVIVTIPLPEGFAKVGETVCVEHTKDNGKKYSYDLTVQQDDDGNLYVAFENENGFSTFAVTGTAGGGTPALGQNGFDLELSVEDNLLYYQLELPASELDPVTGQGDEAYFVYIKGNGCMYSCSVWSDEDYKDHMWALAEAGTYTTVEVRADDNDRTLLAQWTLPTPIIVSTGMTALPADLALEVVQAESNANCVVYQLTGSIDPDLVYSVADLDAKGYGGVNTLECDNKLWTQGLENDPVKLYAMKADITAATAAMPAAYTLNISGPADLSVPEYTPGYVLKWEVTGGQYDSLTVTDRNNKTELKSGDVVTLNAAGKGSVSFTVVPSKGYRIKSFHLQKTDWTANIIGGGYGSCGFIMGGSQTAYLVLEEVPEELPVIQSLTVFEGEKSSETQVGDEVVFTAAMPALNMAVAFDGEESYPAYHANCGWEFSTDGGKTWQKAAIGPVFHAAQMAAKNDYNFDFFGETYLLRAKVCGLANYSSLPAEAPEYIYSDVISVNPLPRLKAPTEVEWGTYYYRVMDYENDTYTIKSAPYPGMISWVVADTEHDHTYKVTVYKKSAVGAGKDEVVWAPKWKYQAGNIPQYCDHDFSLGMLQECGSGEYYFTVQALGDGKTVRDSEVVTSDTWEYIMPTTALSAPEIKGWNGAEIEISWREVNDEYVGGYLVDIYYAPDKDTPQDEWVNADGFVAYSCDGTMLSYALRHWTLEECGTGYYYAQVKAVSANVGTVNHSPFSEFSEPYYYEAPDGGETPDITVIASGICGDTDGDTAADDNLTWTLTSDGVLTISGEGAMQNCGGYSAPWYAYCSFITKVIVEEGVTTIGEWAFAYCDKMEHVTLPESLTTIGYGAFVLSSSLSEITIPANVTQIHAQAFTNCTGLREITFLGNVPGFGDTTYGTNVFLGVTATCYYPADNTSWTEAVMQNYGGTLTWKSAADDGEEDDTEPKLLTRADACVAIVDALGLSYNNETVSFSDVSADHPAYQAIAILVNRNIIAGTGEGKFNPDWFLTRAQLAKLLCAALGKDGQVDYRVLPEDVDETYWAAGWICTAMNHALMCMYEYGGFFPEDFAKVDAFDFGMLAYHGGNGYMVDYELNAPHEEAWNNKNFTGVRYGDGVKLPVCGDNFDCPYHEFMGWYTKDGTKVEDGTVFNEYTTLYARWTERTTFTMVLYVTEITGFDPVTGEEMGDYVKDATVTLTGPMGNVITAEGDYGDALIFRDLLVAEAANYILTITRPGYKTYTITLTHDPYGEGFSIAEIGHYYGGVGFSTAGIWQSLSGSCGPMVNWELTENDEVGNYTLTISGSGWMNGYASAEEQPWAWAREFITKIVVADGVKNIGGYAFANCWNAIEVELADSVCNIDLQAFARCSGLTSVTIPYGVEWINDGAFLQCSSLTEFKMGAAPVAKDETMAIPDPRYTVENGVLFEADWIHDEEKDQWSVDTLIRLVAYPANKADSDYAVPDGVRNIVDYAFTGCRNLKTVWLPKSVSNIWTNAFYRCFGLTAINVAEGNTNYASEGGVLFKSGMETLILYPAGKTDATYEIPASVTCIEEGAFDRCDNLTEFTVAEGNHMYTARNGVLFRYTRMPVPADPDNAAGENGEAVPEMPAVPQMYQKLDALVRYPAGKTDASYTVPEGVHTIESRAFAYAKVNEITIPGMISIWDYAFEKCGSELKVIFQCDGIPVLWEKAFAGATATCYYPAGSMVWENMFNCEEDTNYGGNVTWKPAYDDTKAVTDLRVEQDDSGEYYLTWTKPEGLEDWEYGYRISFLTTDEKSGESFWMGVGGTPGDRFHFHDMPVGVFTAVKVETLNWHTDSAAAVTTIEQSVVVVETTDGGTAPDSVAFIQMEPCASPFLISVSGLRANAPYRLVFRKTYPTGMSHEWSVTWYTNDNGVIVQEVNYDNDSGLTEWLEEAIWEKLDVTYLVQEISAIVEEGDDTLYVTRSACGEAGVIRWIVDGSEDLMAGWEHYAVSNVRFEAPVYGEENPFEGIHALVWDAPVAPEDKLPINTDELDYVVYFYTADAIVADEEGNNSIDWSEWTTSRETGSTELDLIGLAEKAYNYIAVKVVTRVNGIARAQDFAGSLSLNIDTDVPDGTETITDVAVYRQSEYSNEYVIKMTGLKKETFYRFSMWGNYGCEISHQLYTHDETEATWNTWGDWIVEAFADQYDDRHIHYSLKELGSTLTVDEEMGTQHVDLRAAEVVYAYDPECDEMPTYAPEEVAAANVRFEVEDGMPFLRWDDPEKALPGLSYFVFIHYGDENWCWGWDIDAEDDNRIWLGRLKGGFDYHTIRIESWLGDMRVSNVVIDMAEAGMSLTVTENDDSEAKLMIRDNEGDQGDRFLFSGLKENGVSQFEAYTKAGGPNGPSSDNIMHADADGNCEDWYWWGWLDEKREIRGEDGESDWDTFRNGMYRVVEFTVDNDGMNLTITRSSTPWREVAAAIAQVATPNVDNGDVTVDKDLELSKEQIDEVTYVAANVTVDLSVEIKTEGLTDESGKEIVITEESEVSTELALQIEVQEYETPVENEYGEVIGDPNAKSLKLDITPVAIVTVKTPVADQEKPITQTAKTDVNTVSIPVVVTIPLPNGFADYDGQPLYVIHDKGDGTAPIAHRVQARWDNGGYCISFVNTNGFSSFTVTKQAVELTYKRNGTEWRETYDSAQRALDNAQWRISAGNTDVTVKLLLDGVEDNYLFVPTGVTFDLNGKTLKANYLAAFAGSDVVDSSAEKTGLLKVPQANVMIFADNSQLPVWNGEDGYVFTTITFNQQMELGGENSTTIRFKPNEDTAVTNLITAATLNEQVSVVVALSWGKNVQTYTYDPAVAAKVFAKGTLTLTVTGIENITDLKIQAKVISTAGVAIAGKALDAKIAGEQK